MAFLFPGHWNDSAMERITNLVIRYLFIIIAVALFVLPFFWFKNGEIDLGGDSSRLYFYDPLAYIQSHSLYGVSSSGLGAENISYYALPFIICLSLLQLLINSPTALTALFHGISLTIAFWAVYGSVKSILISGRITTHKKYIELSAVTAGLLYVFSPALIYGWDKAIITHSEFFLNPLLFYLLLRFFVTQKSVYLYISLIVTFVFSANFSFVGAPSFFAFYPIAVLFLLLYTKIILQKPLQIRKLVVAGILFLGLQFFHLFPQLSELIEKSSPNNQALFSDQGKLVRGLLYFTSIADSVKVTRNFFLLPQQAPDIITHIFFIVFPLIIVSSFLIKKNRTAILIGLFFLFILFLASANITQIGFEAYKQLFSIPGFSMFRNYWGKWLFVYDFFYVLLFAVAFATVAEKIKTKYVTLLTVGLIILLFANSINFVSGSLLNKNLWDSKRKIFVSMDPNIASVIKKIKSLKIDGKILTLPLADPGYQIFIGENGGAYQGPSLIAYLAAKKDFTGYEDMGPYGMPFLEGVRAKQYDDVQKMLALLNIKYVFYNSSPLVYDEFPNFPYQFVRQFLPPDQRTYPGLINKLGVEPITNFGKNINLYEVQDASYLPHIYVPSRHIATNDPMSSLGFVDSNELRTVLLSINDENNLKDIAEVLIRLDSNNPLYELRDNYHLHTHEPHVSHEPSSKLYSLILLRESYELQSVKRNPDDFITRGLLLSSKRIFELEQYGGDMKVLKRPWRNTDLSFIDDYNSWETSIALYKDIIEELIQLVNESDKDENWKLKNNIIIHEQLTKHEARIMHDIKISNKTREEKQYLLLQMRTLYQSLYKKINLPTFDPFISRYKITLPKGYQGKYEVYITSMNSSKAPYTTLEYLGDTYSSVSEANTEYVKFGPINIKGKDAEIQIRQLQENLIRDPEVGGGNANESKDFSKSNRTFTYNETSQSSFAGIIKTVTGWKPDTQYLISFDYDTHGDDFLFKFYEKTMDKNNDVSVNVYFNKLLHSDSWKTHQTIITSGKDAIAAYVQFISDNNAENAKINIRNLTVTELASPKVHISRVEDKKKSAGVLPKISFVKINPTKYSVTVSNITKPFFLVFSDAFNAKWKLYPTTKTYHSPIIGRYFNNDVIERMPSNVLLDTSIFTNLTVSPLSEKNHYVANGYANAWYITPDDINGKKDASLELEFIGQRAFYAGAIISVLAFCITVFLAIRSYRNEKK